MYSAYTGSVQGSLSPVSSGGSSGEVSNVETVAGDWISL
jgi:hypothetical protein